MLLPQTAIPADELPELLDQLTAADWLANSTVSSTRVTGRLTDRVLPFTCPLP
ncbi:hypothetical protein [Streptomyces sp. NPDC001828]|uniref:hypothetical protein n=1 Tax=Streptomyces sp. NPDC001828 TaxID=3364615 RepID=UPI003691EBE6